MSTTIQISEAVRAGHPDKICDYLADSLADYIIQRDPTAHTAIEVMVVGRKYVFGGEVQTSVPITVQLLQEIIKSTAKTIGFSVEHYGVHNLIATQSPEIAHIVEDREGVKAGDMGIVYGYACMHTPARVPLSYALATRMMWLLDSQYRDWDIGIQPDGKCIVTTREDRIKSVDMNIQTTSTANMKDIKHAIIEKVINPAMAENECLLEDDFQFTMNANGMFTIGGSDADTGVTGRKIQNDTYGTIVPNGGGAFSGKDMSKVDRSGAYYARWLAKQVVTTLACGEILIRLHYRMGQQIPATFDYDTFGSELNENKVRQILANKGKLTVQQITEKFKPARFADYTNYGHFTQNHANIAPWEQID